MSESKANSMVDTVHERVGKLEQVTHTHSHRITQLEQLPDRVSTLERDFAAMNAILTDIKKDTSETREEAKQIRSHQDKVAGAAEALPRHIKIVTFIVLIASLAAVAGVWVQ